MGSEWPIGEWWRAAVAVGGGGAKTLLGRITVPA